MNKQKFKYVCLSFLFTLTLFTISINSHADDTVKKITLSELKTLLENNKGKVIILNLRVTFSPPCRKEIPGFINLYNKYKDKGLEIISVAFDRKGEKALPPFIKKMGINYPVYHEGFYTNPNFLLSVLPYLLTSKLFQRGTVARAYDFHAYPTTIIYDKNGKIVNKHVGYTSEKEFDKEISTLLE